MSHKDANDIKSLLYEQVCRNARVHATTHGKYDSFAEHWILGTELEHQNLNYIHRLEEDKRFDDLFNALRGHAQPP